ncbi:MAG: TraB/GumN family protein [Clostridium sp.]|uniref:TraB/GumN family protein n=1 Tax=Clostridium sp. TaxID=1506 RepID=UPI003EE7C0A2
MKKVKRVLSLAMSTMFVLGAFIGCGADKKEEVKEQKAIAKGYQWEATKDGKSIYLIGTMHPIDTKYDYFSEGVNKIIEKTDVLSVEVNPTEAELLAFATRMVQPEGKSIESNLNEKQIKALKALCEDAKIDYNQVKVFKSFGVSQLISEAIYKKAELTMATFDDQLIEKYNKDGKKVTQVETLEFQGDLLDGILGDEALIQTLDTYTEGSFDEIVKEDVEYAKGLMEAYKNGEEKTMNEAIDMQKEDKETYKALIVDRNKGMVEKIEGYMKEKESYVVAVGTLHFFGDDSIIKMLEDKGYEIKKIS